MIHSAKIEKKKKCISFKSDLIDKNLSEIQLSLFSVKKKKFKKHALILAQIFLLCSLL